MVKITLMDTGEVVARKVNDAMKQTLYGCMEQIVESNACKGAKLRAMKLITERWYKDV